MEIRIVIADAQTLFRDALRCVLEAEPEMQVVGEASTGREALAQVRRQHPDILVLDISDPRLAGIDVVRTLARDEEPVRTLVLSDAVTPQDAVAVLRHGARGILPKRTTTSLLFKSIRAVHRGEYWVGHENMHYLLDHLQAGGATEHEEPRSNAYRLTAREVEIVKAIIDGQTNKEIAQKLAISEQTVKHHLTSVFGKVGVANRLELALFAMQDCSRVFRDN